MELYNPQKIEKRILEFWEKEKIFDKVREKNKGNKRFSFLDGPITANNPMGVHHAWGRTLKDMFQRFKAMQNYDQRYQNGFDCHGLWVEVEVEKELKFKSKKDIEKYGIENFSNRCKERVIKFSEKQTQQSIKLGQWMDWENSYYTMSDNNIETIWLFLKRCHENGWLYEGTKVMPWCPRCGTSLSQHELSDSYKEITHPGLFIKCPLKNGKFLLIWTTTPWTLSSNVAAAVHPDLDYLEVKIDNKTFYLTEKSAKDVLSDQSYIIIRKLKGKELIGMEYESPYQDLPAQKDIKHKVIGWDAVSEEEGTGIVHIAPGCGEEDYELGKKEGLPIISPLDEFGNFIQGFSWLSDKNVKESNNLIINDLKNRGILFKVEDYIHRYPVCWRCGEELVFRLVTEWFIRSKEIKPKMIKEAKKVKWYPAFGEKLMLDWLKNMQDWCISRKRYWGLPLPFYKCSCGNLEVVGSKKELENKAVSGIEQLKELHRPWIDNVKIKCSKCGKIIERVKEVGDCWLDAGIVPFSTLNYLSDKEYWKKWFPAELVCEMREQIKLWFYSMLFMSVTITGKSPYKNVVIYEKIQDENGRPMHKSLGNVIWLDDALERMGADVLRWLYLTHNPKDNLNFGYTIAEEVKKKLIILFNLNNYIKTYLEVNNFKPSVIKKQSNLVKWLGSRLEAVKQNVYTYLENFDFYQAANELENFFIEEFSRWYIHIIREKVKEGYRGGDKKMILFSLYKTQLTLLKMLSPFIPFITEEMYQDFFRKFEKVESIHLWSYPKINKKAINEELEKEMKIIKEIVEVANAIRKEKNIRLKWPVDKIKIETENEIVKKACKDFYEELKIIANVKDIEIAECKQGKEFSNGSVCLGTVLKEDALLRELIRNVQEYRKKMGLKVEDKIILYLNNRKVEKFAKEIRNMVGAKKIVFGDFADIAGKAQFEDEIIGFKLKKFE
ncbi:MAG: isoleucine--tRNA ligase [Candidatus Aenigmatarchaeota archaeon]